MRLRNPKSFLATGPEPAPPPRRASRVTHYVYLLALCSLLGYLGWVVIDHFFFVEARGRVEVETIAIAPERGGRIAELAVEEGQRLERGALIARLAPTENCAPSTDSRLQRLQVDVALARVRIDQIDATLAAKRERDVRLARLRRALEIDTRASREQRELDEEIRELEHELAAQRRELQVRREQMQSIEQRMAVQAKPRACLAEELRAPVAGQVLYVAYDPDEVVTRADTVATVIPAEADVHVEAWLESDRLGRVQPGDAATVRFPDDTRGEGTIAAIRSAAYRATANGGDEAVAEAAGLLLRVVPADPAERQRWLAYERMDVIVRPRR